MSGCSCFPMKSNSNPKKNSGYHEFNDEDLNGLDKSSPTANNTRGDRFSSLSSVPIQEEHVGENATLPPIPVVDLTAKSNTSTKSKTPTQGNSPTNIPPQNTTNGTQSGMLGRNVRSNSDLAKSNREKHSARATRNSDLTGLNTRTTRPQQELRAVFYGEDIDDDDSAHPPMESQDQPMSIKKERCNDGSRK